MLGRPPRPFTKYGRPPTFSRSYVWSWPATTAVAPHCLNGHCAYAVDPWFELEEYGGWCRITSLNGSVAAASLDCSHCACVEVALTPSGSFVSLSSRKNRAAPEANS